MLATLDLLRLFAAFAVIFAVIPYFVFQRQLARGFVHAAFFLQVAAMVLGDWKIFLPGAALALYVLWCAAASWMVRRRQPHVRPSRAIARLIHYLEHRPAVVEPRLAALVRLASSPVAAALLVIAAAFALRASWFALHAVRLLRLESYSRAISLHTLMRGDLWDHDASVALLAPLSWLSGLKPDEAIRFSGALVAALMIAAVAFAGRWRLGSESGAVASAALFAGLMMALGLTPSEPTGAEWSTVFVILAAAFAGQAWGSAAISMLTAVLIYGGLSPVLLLAAMALAIASLLPAVTARVPALTALAVLVIAIAVPPGGQVTEHQYESAARTAHRIANEFRTNDWIVISPGLEVAQTYGRGWHVELADFVNTHSERQVADPDFHFAYSAESVFVFVEKRVLDQPAFSFAHDPGAAPYYYNTRLGRASLEFRAARLMAAYTAAHRNVATYYEDEDLIVYRVTQPAPQASEQSRSALTRVHQRPNTSTLP